MTKLLKDKPLVFLAVLTISCLIIAIVSGQKVGSARDDLNEERYKRMVAEEKLEKRKAANRVLASKLDKAQGNINQLDALLREKKEVVSELRLELEKTTRLNHVLQTELKNALVQ